MEPNTQRVLNTYALTVRAGSIKKLIDMKCFGINVQGMLVILLAIITLQHVSILSECPVRDLMWYLFWWWRWWWPYFRKECLDHQVHAAHIEIH
jgi:hypothetical protein